MYKLYISVKLEPQIITLYFILYDNFLFIAEKSDTFLYLDVDNFICLESRSIQGILRFCFIFFNM